MRKRFYSHLVLFAVCSLSVVSCNALQGNDISLTSSTNTSIISETHEHTFDNKWSFDETKHWHSATCGHDVKKDEENHNWNDVITSPTPEKGGYTTHTCTVCGYSYVDNQTDPITYTITWKNYNGRVLEVDNGVPYGSTPVYNGATPTKAEDSDYTYTWSGWTPDISIVTSNQTYTATFSKEKIKYTINFDLDGGSSPSYTGSQVVESFTKDIFFFDCVKDGWNFRGWSYNGIKIFDEKGNQLSNPTMAKSMTFIAMYAQTAKMNIVSSIEGAGSIAGEGEYPYNSYVDVSAYPYQGYVFVGWYYENTLLSNSNDYKYMMWSGDVTLEARFKLDSFNLNIHTNNNNYGLVLLQTISNNEYRSSYIVKREYTSDITIAAYSKTETRFLGWYDSDNNLVETNAVYSFSMPNHDYELEAKWNYFTITYDLDGGVNSSLNPTGYSIESTGLNLYPPTKQGYDFLGWKFNDSIITSINPEWISNLILVATWKASKNVLNVISEDTSKGTVSIISGTGYSNETIVVEATPANGYFFNGWYQGTSLVSEQIRYTFTMPTFDYSLTARFIVLGITPSIDEMNETVIYGLYPQKNVNDSTLLASLNALTIPESNGWYLYNNEYYAKLSATPYDPKNYVFDNGATIISGETYWFKCEPITWNILSNNNGEYYLLSSALLDAHRYDDDSSNYKDSEIRSWLNNEFYNSAFAFNDNYVKTTNVDNSGFTTHYSATSNASEDTQDKVFLPSYKDYLNANYGFSSLTDRKCKPTDWAKARGAHYYTVTGYGFYWTRSPYESSTGYRGSKVVSSIQSTGDLEYSDIDSAGSSVRPAISFSLSK